MSAQNLQPAAPPRETIWEDLVTDFLEITCFLKPGDQTPLLQELHRQQTQAESIEIHPCFSISGKLIVIGEETLLRECWLFDAGRKQIQRWFKMDRDSPSA